jgi:hypothetical protein
MHGLVKKSSTVPHEAVQIFQEKTSASNTPSNCGLDMDNLLESKLLHLHFAQMSRLQCLHIHLNKLNKHWEKCQTSMNIWVSTKNSSYLELGIAFSLLLMGNQQRSLSTTNKPSP